MNFYVTSEGGYEPAWGPPTSTLNFCELDYQFTPYIAELFNTLTNITYIGLGIRGIFNNRRVGQKAMSTQLPYIALINLGLASSLFHSSLKYYTQMCDEFSMLIATFIVCYRLFSFSQTRLSPRFLAIGLWGLFCAVALAQITTGDSTVQQIVFTGMAYYLWRTCFNFISTSITNVKLKKKMRIMSISGIAFFVSGHLCWLTDFYACHRLRSFRDQIGMPWAALLELHGYWHILTGIGVYIFMVLVECLQHAPTGGKAQTGNLRVSTTGSWPFPVFLEEGTAGKSTGPKKGKKAC